MARKAHPKALGAQYDGRAYLFDHCRELEQSHTCHDGDQDDDDDDGGGKAQKSAISAGDLVSGDSFSLHVDKGDNQDPAKKTAIDLVLNEEAPCAGRVARLASVDFLSWDATIIGTFLRHADWSTQTLGIDLDGAVLLASSNPSASKHSIFKLDVRGPGGPTVKGIEQGAAPLVLPPVVDARGVTFVTETKEGVKRVRKRKLELSPATLADLAKQL